MNLKAVLDKPMRTAELAKIVGVRRTSIFKWKRKGMIQPIAHELNRDMWDLRDALPRLAACGCRMSAEALELLSVIYEENRNAKKD